MGAVGVVVSVMGSSIAFNALNPKPFVLNLSKHRPLKFRRLTAFDKRRANR